jgi:hypothetical protein
MAYSQLKLIKKSSSRTRAKGGQLGNSNAVKHGAFSKVRTGLEMLKGNSGLYMHLSEWRANVIADLGGEDNLSEIELTLIRRALYLERKLILFETQQHDETGKDTDAIYLSWCNTQRLTLDKLGLKRRKRELKLSDYLKQKGQAG